MSAVSGSLRLTIRQRAQGRCEYCLIHEENLLFAHEPDHIIAAQHGGATIAENLALACVDCNRRKGPNLSSIDPNSSEVVRLFNPRRDVWSEHLAIEGARVTGLIPTGRDTVFLLQMNSEERIRLRVRLQRLGRYPRARGGD